MTALGVGVSDRDAVSDWGYIKPRQRSPLEIEYIRAMDESNRLSLEFVKAVDELVNLQDYATLDALWAECEEAEAYRRLLYKRMNCDHFWVDDEPFCQKCSADYYDTVITERKVEER